MTKWARYGDDTPSHALTWLVLLIPLPSVPGPPLPTQHQGAAWASATFLKFAFEMKGRFWNRRRF